MNGIEILSTRICADMQEIPFILSLIIPCVICAFICLFAFDGEEALAALGCIIGCVIGLLFYVIVFEKIFPVNYTEYKVTISDEVSMTEFYEKYEILDVDGKIYTIREREIE